MVVNAVHQCPELNIEYPRDEEDQRNIASGFKKHSDVQFDTCAGAIDGMLVWTEKPLKEECKVMECGEKRFMCGRKGKFGFPLVCVFLQSALHVYGLGKP